jgi:hypothetical protein
LYIQFTTNFGDFTHGSNALTMASDSRQPFGICPTTVTIHYDGNMPRNIMGIDFYLIFPANLGLNTAG